MKKKGKKQQPHIPFANTHLIMCENEEQNEKKKCEEKIVWNSNSDSRKIAKIRIYVDCSQHESTSIVLGMNNDGITCASNVILQYMETIKRIKSILFHFLLFVLRYLITRMPYLFVLFHPLPSIFFCSNKAILCSILAFPVLLHCSVFFSLCYLPVNPWERKNKLKNRFGCCFSDRVCVYDVKW